jgi:hypothetical protein
MQIMGEEIRRIKKEKKKREGGSDFVTNIPDGLDYNRQTTLFLCLFSHDSSQIARFSVFPLYSSSSSRERDGTGL